MDGIHTFPRQMGWVVTTSEGSRFRSEEGGQTSIYSSRTRRPSCGVFGHPSLCTGWLILPAALLSAQSEV